MSSVTGVFNNAADADHAVARLVCDGFSKKDISLISSGENLSPPYDMEDLADIGSNSLAEGGFMGAAIGGAAGALLASLSTVGLIMLPGGGMLMAGPIVAALAGAGAGGIIGGLAGMLIGVGFAMDEAQKNYQEEVDAGKSIVVVNAADEIKEARARVALRGSGGIMRVA